MNRFKEADAMSHQSKRPAHEPMNNDGFRIVCSIATLFLAVVLAVDGIGQLAEGSVFGGVIGLLGTVLMLLSGAILLSGLVKRLIARIVKK